MPAFLSARNALLFSSWYSGRASRAAAGPARLLLFLVLGLLLLPHPVCAQEDTAPATAGAEASRRRSFATGAAFFDDASLSGGVYYFQRDRRRYNRDKGRYTNNLNHATVQANLDFSSGFLGGAVGVDFAVFASADLHNSGSPDHEMNFFPWGDPWHPDWNKKNAKDGVSVYKAALKFKADSFWGKAGYFQPSGPGVLGVNWSVMPGTYRGANIGYEAEGLSVALAWADAYKAPWYVEMNDFRKNDGESAVSWMWSSGLRYDFASGLSLEAAYGSSKGHLKAAHVKSSYAFAWEEGSGKGLTLGYQLYLMADSDDSGASENDNFAGVASQHYAYAHLSLAPWLFKLEGTFTRAPFDNEYQQGFFVYRLTDRNGSSKGAYDMWWDARSDWNHHNEKALYAYVGRTLDDIMPVPGFSAGGGAVIGWDGEAYDTAEHLKEWAFVADVGYTHPSGTLEGAFIKLHYTEYRNASHKASWAPYKNAFEDERDIKLFMGIPFDL